MDNPTDERNKGRGEGDHGDDDHKPPFDPRTYLYIRTHPSDDGTEPLTAGWPFWISPDIIITPNGGMPGDVAMPGVNNQVSVTVTNKGGIDAIDAYVDVFLANPSTAFTPATATPLGDGFLTIPGYNTATITINWLPGPADSGHRCLLARVSLLTTGDTYVNPAVFDVVGDRHVAQRNIHVVEMTGQQAMTFGFMIVNPFDQATDFQIQLEELKAEGQLMAQVRQVLRCSFAQFDNQPLGAVTLGFGDGPPDETDAAKRIEALRPAMGVLKRSSLAASGL